MNILFVVPYVPNLIRVRPYNFIKSLYERGHHVTLVTLWQNDREKADLRDLHRYCEDIIAEPLTQSRPVVNCISNLPTTVPLQYVYCWNPRLFDRMNVAIQQNRVRTPFDLVHVEHLRGARYGRQLLKASNTLPILWDSVDCISYLFDQTVQQTRQGVHKFIAKFELGRTKRYEAVLVQSFSQTIVTSQIDKQALESLVGTTEQLGIRVIPNGVDLDYFAPARVVEREPATLVMTGKMSYHANITMCLHFVNDILPLIWQLRPEVKLWIVGKDPPRFLRELGQDPRIIVTGEVPDLRPYLRKATLAVTPTRYGAGIQNKVLEAMASGTPVVMSGSAATSLNISNGREAFIADDPNGFARAVIQMLKDTNIQSRLSTAGRAFVERNHDWKQITKQLEALYDGLIKANG